MRAVRLKPSDLNKSYAEFYMKVGANNGQGRVFPGYVFLSEEDDARLRRANRRLERAEAPRASKKQIDEQIEFAHSNYGPNELLAKAVRPGYALVDDEGIQKSLRAEQAEYDAAMAEQAPVAEESEEVEELEGSDRPEQPIGLVERIANFFSRK